MEFTSQETTVNLLKCYAVGPRKPDDEFFKDGNSFIKPFVKLGVLSEIVLSESNPEENDISCNVPDCNFFCLSVVEYEFHYNSQHRYTCAQCKKSLPNAHLLDIHLSETHDSYFAAQVQSSNRLMYVCFLEECKHRSKDPAERKDHCIREHKFPHNFRFDKQLYSKVGKSTKSTSRGTSIVSNMAVEQTTPLRCKKNFSFGHPQQRTFMSSKHSGQKCDILENNRMVVDLLDSLPKE
ncbi:protein lethal(2)k10201 [Anopheles nili]|uniref:protein lethal(2)k10201 n=1 Tax=Anopheles nili TaxID=185578 RepID=UPI00237C14A3|nr:protein lethal(2)k10201 [Anopheles nili]